MKTRILWKKLHSFFAQVPVDTTLLLYNQDLVGFFTSLPIPRITSTVAALLQEYCDAHSLVLNHAEMTIDVKSPSKHFRLFRGFVKSLQTLGKRALALKHVSNIVDLSFQLNAFTTLNQCWLQHRGTAIGSHISPALCCVALAYHEIQWQRSFQRWHISQTCLHSIRYVDKDLFSWKLLLLPPILLELCYIQTSMDRQLSWKMSQVACSWALTFALQNAPSSMSFLLLICSFGIL